MSFEPVLPAFSKLPVPVAGLVSTPAAVLPDVPHSAAATVEPFLTGKAASKGSACCDIGRHVATDPVTGHVICSCEYDSGRLPVTSCGPRLSADSAGTPLAYGASTGSPLTYLAAAYPSTEHNPYPSIGVDSTAYFPEFANPYRLNSVHQSIFRQTTDSSSIDSYHQYDSTLLRYQSPFDMAVRKKNATRECTSTLKAWLSEHKKNPYPTKGEKIMLAIITKMTLTQVSTWFANARRRLKKENKMTWKLESQTKSDDEEDTRSNDELNIPEAE